MVSTIRIEMPWCFGASGSVRHGQPEVVGLVAAGGPELLPVDDVVVAVALARWCAARPGRCRRPARCSRSRSARRPRGSAGGTGPSASVGAVADQRRADGLQGDRRQVHVGALRLVGEDRLLDLAEPVAAVLLRPADAHPAVAAHLLDRLLVRRAVPVAAIMSRCSSWLGQPGEVVAQLGLERALRRRSARGSWRAGSSIRTASQRSARGPPRAWARSVTQEK